MNKFTVNYDKKTLDLEFEGEVFNFSLSDGDVGDFWHSLKQKDGTEKDINFYQDNENEEPTLAVYSLKDNEYGEMLIDTSDFVVIDNFEQIGNPKNYFN